MPLYVVFLRAQVLADNRGPESSREHSVSIPIAAITTDLETYKIWIADKRIGTHRSSRRRVYEYLSHLRHRIRRAECGEQS